MSVPDPVRAIADAVLYEGYVLWPYRRSALKNQQRWTFGGVFPRDHSERHPDDRWTIRGECLLEGDEAHVEARVRFLHVVERAVHDADDRRVDELTVDGTRHLAWDEAVEREVAVGLDAVEPVRVPAGADREALSEDGRRAGALVRSWAELEGTVTLRAASVEPGVRRIAVEVANTTPWTGGPRADALRRAFCSTHVVLRTDGAFVSQTDPPEHLRAAAAACRNEGLWPVLVGDPGDRRTVLASPIILEDHPRIAPESPGDLFDGGEIDQLLVLNILALTDEEKAEMRDSDPRTRAILERTERLTGEQLLRLHGTIR